MATAVKAHWSLQRSNIFTNVLYHFFLKADILARIWIFVVFDKGGGDALGNWFVWLSALVSIAERTLINRLMTRWINFVKGYRFPLSLARLTRRLNPLTIQRFQVFRSYFITMILINLVQVYFERITSICRLSHDSIRCPDSILLHEWLAATVIRV